MPAAIVSPVAYIAASAVAGTIWMFGTFWAHPQHLTVDQFLAMSILIGTVVAIPAFIVRFFMGAGRSPIVGALVGGCLGFAFAIVYFSGVHKTLSLQSREIELFTSTFSLVLAGASAGAVFCWIEGRLNKRIGS